MKFTSKSLKIEGAYILNRSTFLDERGEFSRIFDNLFFEDKLEDKVRNINYSNNPLKNTFRGFHGCANPSSSETKVIVPISGSIIDFIYDPSANNNKGLLEIQKLSASKKEIIIVPRRYLNAFLTLEDNTSLIYITDNNYTKEGEFGARFNDKKINIPDEFLFQIKHLSIKDKNWPDL